MRVLGSQFLVGLSKWALISISAKYKTWKPIMSKGGECPLIIPGRPREIDYDCLHGRLRRVLYGNSRRALKMAHPFVIRLLIPEIAVANISRMACFIIWSCLLSKVITT